MALVNQQRVGNGLTTIGQANSTLYQLAATVPGIFHDISDHATNGFYSSVTVTILRQALERSTGSRSSMH